VRPRSRLGGPERELLNLSLRVGMRSCVTVGSGRGKRRSRSAEIDCLYPSTGRCSSGGWGGFSRGARKRRALKRNIALHANNREIGR
jgi:hypothetical protein